MQPRLARLFSASVASVLLGLLLVAVPVQAGGEFRRFPEGDSQAAADDSQIEELKELLRQAKQLQDAQRKVQDAAREKAAEVVGRDAGATPPAGPAGAGKLADPADKAAGENDVVQNGAVAEGAEEPEEEKKAAGAARPGCMYRGDTLIWEKVSGTCVR